jgi:hypothetical protein
MPSLTQGSSSSAATPVLDVWTAVGNPLTVIDVAILQFRILDVSTDSKKVNPVQVYPSTPGTWQSVDPTTSSPAGVRLSTGHYFAPWTVPLAEPIGDHRIEWQFKQAVNSPFEAFSEDFYVAANPSPGSIDPSLYCTVGDIRAEGFLDPNLYPDSRIMSLISTWSRFVDKATGRWFYPKEFSLANRPSFPSTTIAAASDGLSLPRATIAVASTAGFSSSGGILKVTTSAGVQTVRYDGVSVDGLSFVGCTGGTGTMSVGEAVQNALQYPTVNLLPGVAYPVPTQINLQAGDNPLRVNGQGRRDLVTCDFEIPICRLDALGIENQAFLFSQITWLELSSVRVYNRHLLGMTQPDDRENPHIGFTVAGRIVETIASGLYPAPRIFPHGRLNVFLFGAFGYTEVDSTGQVPEGVTPELIRQATKLLVIRDLLPESKRKFKLPFQNMHRIIGDREGSTDVRLQEAWLKGGVIGDPEIDRILTMYHRPPRIGVA